MANTGLINAGELTPNMTGGTNGGQGRISDGNNATFTQMVSFSGATFTHYAHSFSGTDIPDGATIEGCELIVHARYDGSYTAMNAYFGIAHDGDGTDGNASSATFSDVADGSTGYTGTVGIDNGGGDITGVVRLSSQKALNPHLEAIFEKINMREFNYTFRFTPKNEREVDTVDKIIKLFKFHMMPEKPIDAAIGRYLTMPSEFEIHYMYKGVENTYLPFVSNSVLTGVDVAYGPGGQYQTFKPKATPDGDAPPPTEIEMKLSFMETEALTKEKIMEGY